MKKATSLTIDPVVLSQMKKISEARARSLSNMVEIVLTQYINSPEGTEALEIWKLR